MKIAVIGGGASGLVASILIKRKHQDYQVTIFEAKDELGKKISATGNGKCNFSNSGSLNNVYTNEEFALPILNEFNYKDIISFFASIGVISTDVGKLIYPMSESALTVVNKLVKEVARLKIDVRLSIKVTDYQISNNKIIINNEEFDKAIFASGGKSSPQLGSDGSLYPVFEKHGYKITNLSPSLCPIRINENVKRLDGVRAKVLLKVVQNEKLIHEESGELLFKKDGLSGIVTFNSTHYINQLNDKKNIKIVIDFVPTVDEKISEDKYDNYLNPKLADYLSFHHLDIKNTVFSFKEMYDFNFSQVTSGGICIFNVNNNLSSKIENNVYFIGELLNVDAICGGFNLMWAFASANKVANSL